MISIFKTDNIKNTEEGRVIYAELRGLSTDTKPTTIGESEIGNGSAFIEIDTQNIFFFDGVSKEWKGIE
jgi:hypothetical protein